MIDGIRIDYSYPTKTIIESGSASAMNYYILAGYSLETILWHEKNFQKDVEKIINHIIKTEETISHRPDLRIFTSESKGYSFKQTYIISKDDKGLYLIPFSKSKNKQYISKSEIKKILVDFYREAMFIANQQTA